VLIRLRRGYGVTEELRQGMNTKNDAAKIDSYMSDIDRTLLRENLKLTPAQRLEKFVKFMRFTSELGNAGKKTRRRTASDR